MGFQKTNTQTNQTQNTWKNKNIQQPPAAPTQAPQINVGLEYIGVYVGAEMKGRGIMKQGKKQGQPWTLLRLNFVTGTPEYQRNTHFSAFTPLTQKNGKGLQINQLEMGKEYKVLYNEKPYTNEYGDQIGKTAFMIFEPTLNKQIPSTYNQVQQGSPAVNHEAIPEEATDCIPPEYQSVWSNAPDFSSEAEWIKIAEESGVFDSPDDAKKVFEILSKQ